jgi:antitoxin component YwqK of YwqJK toxin-antitoxin module
MSLYWRFGTCISAVLIGTLSAFGQANTTRSSSADTQQESVKVEPYTGPPIFLPETEQVVAKPAIVNRETIPEKYGDGKLRIERQVAHYSDNSFAADGTYREFHPNGKPFVEGQFKDGRQIGEWKYYFDNGKPNRTAKYKDGKPDGSWEVFRADGTLLAKRGFKDGKRDGEWITYDDTGKKPRTEEHYVDGKQDGVVKIWYPDGQQKLEWNFKNGKQDGKSTNWDEKGQKILEAEYTDGKLNGTATRWFADGKKVVQQYENGKLKSETKQ